MTATPPTRNDIAIPLKDGIVSVVLSGALLVALAYVAVVPGYHLATSVLGRRPSLVGGHPYDEASGIAIYAITAWFAWRRLRPVLSRTPCRVPTRPDVVVMTIAVLVTIGVDRAYDWLLYAVGQGDHVQAGFEGFSMAMSTRAETILAIALTLLNGAVAGPVAEELISRGLLFGALISRYSVVAAAALSGIVFGAVHCDPILFVILALDGVILALAYAATGNLVVSMVVHGITNAISFAPLIVQALSRTPH